MRCASLSLLHSAGDVQDAAQTIDANILGAREVDKKLLEPCVEMMSDA